MPQRKQRNLREERRYSSQVGTRIQFLRLEQRLSLRTVAERGECSVSALTSIEHGLAAMTTVSIHAIAKGLDVQPFDLLNHDPDSSDVGALLELLRLHPEYIPSVHAKLSALTS